MAALSQVSLSDVRALYEMDYDPHFIRFAEAVIGRVQATYREWQERRT